jgi:hypothetical protein
MTGMSAKYSRIYSSTVCGWLKPIAVEVERLL